MKIRRLSLIVWFVAVAATAGWWPLSYRYSAGFVATNPFQANDPAGIAALSGMGKVIVYVSWSSRFARHGAFIEPVMAHEFPHPWFGFQWEGGRLWASLPAGLIAGLVAAAAAWHLRIGNRTPTAPVDSAT